MKDTKLYKLYKDILKAIANDAKMPVKKIAEVVYASVPTVNSRIIELTNKGVIKGYYTEIDNSVFEDSIKCYIDIEISPAHREKLFELAKQNKNLTIQDIKIKDPNNTVKLKSAKLITYRYNENN